MGKVGDDAGLERSRKMKVEKGVYMDATTVNSGTFGSLDSALEALGAIQPEVYYLWIDGLRTPVKVERRVFATAVIEWLEKGAVRLSTNKERWYVTAKPVKEPAK